MSSPDAPRTLVEQVKAGDQTALERLLLEHSDTLSTHIAQRIPASLRSVIGVEDVMQQTFMRAFDKIDQLQDSSPGAFVAWLKAIGATTLMGIIKTERRQKRGGKFRQVQHVKNNVTESLVDLLEQLPGDVATAGERRSQRYRSAFRVYPRSSERRLSCIWFGAKHWSRLLNRCSAHRRRFVVLSTAANRSWPTQWGAHHCGSAAGRRSIGS